MYVEKKRIGKSIYNYLKVSARANSKVITKTVAYLGKEPMSKKEIKARIAHIPKYKLENIKKEIKEIAGIDVNKEFLSDEQFQKLEGLKKDFSRKIGIKDEKLVEDMFRDFKTFYIYNTNAIEGNTLTLEETNLLLNENKTPEGRDLKEIYDHINEKETVDFIRKNRIEITKESIIKIHSMLLKNIDKRIGGFRLHDVRILGSRFETSPAKFVETDMALLLKWHNKNKRILHPLVLAAIFHEKFERIHPFYDGNGRTGRMLVNIILMNSGYPPIIIESKERKRYYEVLSIAHDAGLTAIDIKPYKSIVEFFYEKIVSTYERIFSKWG